MIPLFLIWKMDASSSSTSSAYTHHHSDKALHINIITLLGKTIIEFDLQWLLISARVVVILGGSIKKKVKDNGLKQSFHKGVRYQVRLRNVTDCHLIMRVFY